MYLSDLDELEDVLYSVGEEIDQDQEEEQIQIFNEKEECELIETMIQLMYDYVDENPTEISEPDFHESMMENVRDLILSGSMLQIINGNNNNNNNNNKEPSDQEYLEDEVENLLQSASELFYIKFIPCRSYPYTFVRSIPHLEQIHALQKKIDYLKSKPQPEQRTAEWYTFRHNLITASNAYKAFENPSVQNQLIYEKCVQIENKENNKPAFVNVESPLHWGQKYEPISVMYYEKEYDTHVGDFGCIQHETFSFLGASPDGINIDKKRPARFGRMLEIKNIVNREIDGIPKKEYWIQMQLQMETCDLDECDFLETRFVEYENEELFLSDGSFKETFQRQTKGIIMYFSDHDGRPKYIYKPLDMDKHEFDCWFDAQMESHPNYCWIKNIYWRLEEVSCVLVLRNRKWFEDNISQIKKIWNIIENERETGYEHRAPNKRVKRVEEKSKQNENKIENYFDLGIQVSPLEKNGCLINMNGQPNQSQSTKNQKSNLFNENVIIRVRTESMDETKQALQQDTS